MQVLPNPESLLMVFWSAGLLSRDFALLLAVACLSSEAKVLSQMIKVSQSVIHHFIRSQFAVFTGQKDLRDNNSVGLKSAQRARAGQTLLRSSISLPPLLPSTKLALKIVQAGSPALPISYQLSSLSPCCLMHAGTVATKGTSGVCVRMAKYSSVSSQN